MRSSYHQRFSHCGQVWNDIVDKCKSKGFLQIARLRSDFYDGKSIENFELTNIKYAEKILKYFYYCFDP